jgi:signal transduction histidine kinase
MMGNEDPFYLQATCEARPGFELWQGFFLGFRPPANGNGWARAAQGVEAMASEPAESSRAAAGGGELATAVQRAFEGQPGPGPGPSEPQGGSWHGELEVRLLQFQKLEALGRLAMGIAHEFNNLIGVVMGYSELALHRLPDADPVSGDLQEIRRAAERAAALTQQLLTFGRRRTAQASVLDLNAVLRDMVPMLQCLLRKEIDLQTDLAPGLGLVEADPGQIEQVLMNLVVNARDATGKGGTITLTTDNAELAEPLAHPHGVVPAGSYVRLGVRDTGSGMTADTLARVFEPFFSTKEPGKGTGLGLPIVAGIVRHAGGHVTVTSEAGRGTTFHVYWPRHDAAGTTVRDQSRAG